MLFQNFQVLQQPHLKVKIAEGFTNLYGEQRFTKKYKKYYHSPLDNYALMLYNEKVKKKIICNFAYSSLC